MSDPNRKDYKFEHYQGPDAARVDHREAHFHAPEVSEGRPYPCRVCTRSFDRPSLLNQHILVHTGEKPFLCQYCGQKRYGTASNLYRHQRRCPQYRESESSRGSRVGGVDELVEVENEEESDSEDVAMQDYREDDLKGQRFVDHDAPPRAPSLPVHPTSYSSLSSVAPSTFSSHGEARFVFPSTSEVARETYAMMRASGQLGPQSDHFPPEVGPVAGMALGDSMAPNFVYDPRRPSRATSSLPPSQPPADDYRRGGA